MEFARKIVGRRSKLAPLNRALIAKSPRFSGRLTASDSFTLAMFCCAAITHFTQSKTATTTFLNRWKFRLDELAEVLTRASSEQAIGRRCTVASSVLVQHQTFRTRKVRFRDSSGMSAREKVSVIATSNCRSVLLNQRSVGPFCNPDHENSRAFFRVIRRDNR